MQPILFIGEYLMPQKHVSFFANVNKSQIKETDTHFTIEGVPVTVDDAVMNGLHYPAEHNKQGMNTIADRVVVLSHPTDANGLGADAYAGASLQEFYSGGHIETVYSKNGVWYVNISIKKSLLKVQDNDQGSDFYTRLSNRSEIGVSTGLYTDAKKQSGVNAKGDKFEYVATNQQYNHLAMLNASEPPAGGQDTFMRFNGEAQGLVINLAEYMSDSIPETKIDIDDDEPKKDDELNSLLAKLLAIIGIGKLAGNGNGTNNADNAEDNLMTTAEKMAALKAKGKQTENMSDDEVSNAYEKMMKNSDDSVVVIADNSDKVLSAITGLSDTITALNAKVEGLQTQVNESNNKQKSALVNKLKDLKTGLSENSLNTLPVEELETMYTNATGKTVSLSGAVISNQNSVTDYSGSFNDTSGAKA